MVFNSQEHLESSYQLTSGVSLQMLQIKHSKCHQLKLVTRSPILNLQCCIDCRTPRRPEWLRPFSLTRDTNYRERPIGTDVINFIHIWPGQEEFIRDLSTCEPSKKEGAQVQHKKGYTKELFIEPTFQSSASNILFSTLHFWPKSISFVLVI